MSKLFVVNYKATFVIEADNMDDAFERLEDLDRSDSMVWENETMSEATTMNMSRHWGGLAPSNNQFCGKPLRDIAPELFLGD